MFHRIMIIMIITIMIIIRSRRRRRRRRRRTIIRYVTPAFKSFSKLKQCLEFSIPRQPPPVTQLILRRDGS